MRRSAVTPAQLTRALKAAKAAGLKYVKVDLEAAGRVRLHLWFDEVPTAGTNGVEDVDGANEWDEVYEEQEPVPGRHASR